MTGSGKDPLFGRIALIGAGLIGSSLARVIRREGLARHIAVTARTQKTLDKIQELGLADSVSLEATDAVKDADLVVLCAPLGTRSEEHTSELQSRRKLVCRPLLEKKKKKL